MILPDAREFAFELVAKELRMATREATPLVRRRTEGLIGICVEFDVPIELLLQWIRYVAPDGYKVTTSAEWRRWCSEFAITRREWESAQLAAKN